jgi:hypothetical protein
MSKEVIEKYEDLRMSINGNLNTIRSLLNQADKLNGLVGSLSDDDEQKKDLEQSIKELYKIINDLIKQTNILFKQYAEFANSVTRARVN